MGKSIEKEKQLYSLTDLLTSLEAKIYLDPIQNHQIKYNEERVKCIPLDPLQGESLNDVCHQFLVFIQKTQNLESIQIIKTNILQIARHSDLFGRDVVSVLLKIMQRTLERELTLNLKLKEEEIQSFEKSVADITKKIEEALES